MKVSTYMGVAPRETMGPHTMSAYGMCVNCGHAVHTVGHESTAVHTTTGMFSCGWASGVSGVSDYLDLHHDTNFASIAGMHNLSALMDRAAEQGHDDGVTAVLDEVRGLVQRHERS